MRLHTVHIQEFKSIWDSNPFEVDKVTCLVGKNESGKTAILQALYRLNPIVENDGKFDVTDDYPRSEVEDYQQDVESGRRKPAATVNATFELEASELDAIRAEFGDGVLKNNELGLSTGYAGQRFVSLSVVESILLKNLVEMFELPKSLAVGAAKIGTLTELSQYLKENGKKQNAEFVQAQAAANQLPDDAEKAAALEKSKPLAESEQAKALQAKLTDLLKHKHLSLHIYQRFLEPHLPKFFYFDEYYQMRGHDNIEALKKRQAENKLLSSDHPLLGLIDLARLDLDKLLASTRTQELKNKLQGASNHLSSQILKYWSQNKHLSINFDVRPGLPQDPEGMTTGTNIWGEIYDAKHQVSTGLGTRSAGFVWFFSFLAWYSSIKKTDVPLVLLLDEPGLSLHGKAQEDLLHYFDIEIATNLKHQLIYTTHSPFMVDSQHFERIRIVQDKSIDSDDQLSREEDGTKVFTDIMEAGPDSLFPLQGALGYEIYQSLFIGPNSLIVEGVSDLLYLQTVSGILQAANRIGLDKRWTITPVGGSDKVPTFVSLIGSQKKLNIATLTDFQKGDQQMLENLYKKKLLKKNHVLTFSDFTGTPEADIEDMFDNDFYIQLVNSEFAGSLASKVKLTDLTNKNPRIIVKIEDYFNKKPLKAGDKFNHYRPARFFAERGSALTIPDTTLDRFEKAFRATNALLPS